MNIQITMMINTRRYDNAFMTRAIENIVLFTRGQFPEMTMERRDSPVTVKIFKLPEETWTCLKCWHENPVEDIHGMVRECGKCRVPMKETDEQPI